MNFIKLTHKTAPHRLMLSAVIVFAVILLPGQLRAEQDAHRIDHAIQECLAAARSPQWTEQTTERMFKHLQASDSRIRWTAAWALGHGPVDVAGRLGALANQEATAIRRPIALALSELVDRDDSALLPLCELLHSDDPIERFYVHRGLSRVTLDNPSLRMTLLRLPSTMERWTFAGKQVHRLPNRYGTNKVPGLNLRAWHHQKLLALGPPTPADLEWLVPLLNAPDTMTRRLAVAQIGMLRERAQGTTKDIRLLLSDHDDSVCQEAIRTLQLVGTTPAEDEKVLFQLLDDSRLLRPKLKLAGIDVPLVPPRSREVGQAAVSSLAQIKPEQLTTQLVRSLRYQTLRSDEERTLVAQSLAQSASVPPHDLVSLLSHPTERVRRDAALAIGAFGERAATAVPVLVQTLKAELRRDRLESRVTRQALLETLGRIGPAARDAVPALREIRKTASPRQWQADIDLVIDQCLGRQEMNPKYSYAISRELQIADRRQALEMLFCEATNRESLSHLTRNEAVTTLARRYAAQRELNRLTAAIVNEFTDNLQGNAASRAEAVQRLQDSFNSLAEADDALRRLSNSYRWNRLHSSVGLARSAMELHPRRSAANSLDLLPAVLQAHRNPGGQPTVLASKFAAMGPPGAAFIARFANDKDDAQSRRSCLLLRSMGYWALDESAALVQAARNNRRFARSALERIDPDAYHRLDRE